MSSTKAVTPSATTATFFGGAAAVPKAAMSPALVVNDVTPDDAGLRLLASAGRWAAAAALAERLEGDHLEQRTMYPTEASLKYTLVRVQSYIKLQMFDRVKQVFDTLGNFNDSRFCAAAGSVVGPASSYFSVREVDSSRKSIVPFSLWFLHAQVPMLCHAQQTALQDSQQRLYELLARCELQVSSSSQPAGSTTPSHPGAATTAAPAGGSLVLWRQRARRVRRALVGNHFELEQFSSALVLQRDIADTETNELQHLVAVQMLGCMCLRSGNSTLATEVFRSIERMQVDDEAYDAETNASLASTKEVMVAMNHALLLSFHGYFGEACATLRNIMSGVPVDQASMPTTVVSSTSAASGAVGAQAEALAVRQQMRRYATTSLCACLPFLHRNDAPDAPPAPPLNSSVSVPVLTLTTSGSAAASNKAAEPSHPLATPTTSPTSTLPRTSVQSLLLFLEEQVRVDPRGMLHIDAFIQNYYRAVDLENAAPLVPEGGGAAAVPSSLLGAASPLRGDVMEGLLEQFRGWRDSRRGRPVTATTA
jgi:hypothetical protein